VHVIPVSAFPDWTEKARARRKIRGLLWRNNVGLERPCLSCFVHLGGVRILHSYSFQQSKNNGESKAVGTGSTRALSSSVHR
jgi:hypothetical protein